MNTTALLTKEFLAVIGVSMSDEERAAFSEHYEAALTERVINEIVLELNDTQLEALREYRGKSDEELQSWLRANVPQLDEIITDEVAVLLGEIAENSDSI